MELQTCLTSAYGTNIWPAQMPVYVALYASRGVLRQCTNQVRVCVWLCARAGLSARACFCPCVCASGNAPGVVEHLDHILLSAIRTWNDTITINGTVAFRYTTAVNLATLLARCVTQACSRDAVLETHCGPSGCAVTLPLWRAGCTAAACQPIIGRWRPGPTRPRVPGGRCCRCPQAIASVLTTLVPHTPPAPSGEHEKSFPRGAHAAFSAASESRGLKGSFQPSVLRPLFYVSREYSAGSREDRTSYEHHRVCPRT